MLSAEMWLRVVKLVVLVVLWPYMDLAELLKKDKHWILANLVMLSLLVGTAFGRHYLL